MKKIILVMFCILILGCGSGSDPEMPDSSFSVTQENTTIHSIAIGIYGDPIEVGEPTQLLLTVILNTGETLNGLTTKYNDPQSGQYAPILWDVSDDSLAFIDAGARLVPVTEGYVTITAGVMNKSDSRVVKINGEQGPQFSIGVTDDGDESDGEGDLESCQGHAAGVSSFEAGSGAGFGSLSFPGIVLGPPHGGGELSGSTHVLSLGANGEIVLDVGDCQIVDGPGIDFIVFENPFLIGGDPLNPYAELGVVGVSEDGDTFVEFSCNDEEYPYSGCAGWHPVYSSIDNGISPLDPGEAGGDQFDLSRIGVDRARFIRIRDLDGVGFGTSVGFDLDAISVVNGLEE